MELSKYKNVKVIDPIKYQCDEEKCKVFAGETQVNADDNHLNIEYVEKYIHYLDETLLIK